MNLSFLVPLLLSCVSLQASHPIHFCHAAPLLNRDDASFSEERYADHLLVSLEEMVVSDRYEPSPVDFLVKQGDFEKER